MTDGPEPSPLPADELQTLWQDQPTEVYPMLLADVHKRAVRFETLQRWNFIAFALIALFGLAMAGWVMLHVNDGLLSVGYSLLALGMLFAFYYRHNRNRTNAAALAGGSQECLEFYKSVLKRRIQLARTAWAWAMMPLLPGTAVIFYRAHQIVAASRANPIISPAQAVSAYYGIGIFLIVFLAARFLMQQRRARKLTVELQDLDG